jgi:hypothetical protein
MSSPAFVIVVSAVLLAATTAGAAPRLRLQDERPQDPPASGADEGAAGQDETAAGEAEKPAPQVDPYARKWLETPLDVDGAALLGKAAELAGAERFATVKSLAYRRDSNHYRVGRFVMVSAAASAFEIGKELVGYVEEPLSIDRNDRLQRFRNVVNGDDCFQLNGLEVLSAPRNEGYALAAVAHETVLLTAPLLLHRLGAKVDAVHRCEIDEFEPAITDPDVGVAEYQPVKRTLLRLDVTVPGRFAAGFGPNVEIYVDPDSGRYVMLGGREHYSADLYGKTKAVLYEVVETQDADGLVLPRRIAISYKKSAERLEMVAVGDVEVDPELPAGMLKRP